MFSGREGEEDEPPPPLEMKEPFLLRGGRETHLLAGKVGVDPYMSNGNKLG